MAAAFLAAADITEHLTRLPGQLGHIFYFIVLPVLMLAGIGFVLQRKVKLDMHTLKVLNFYVVIPAMIYATIVTARLSGQDMLLVVGFTACMIVSMATLSLLIGRLTGVPKGERPAMMMGSMFANSGNFSIPLQELALGPVAASLQAFVMITYNFTQFTVGVTLAALGSTRHADWRKNVRKMLSFPPLYALAAGIVTVQVQGWLGDGAGWWHRAIEPFWYVLSKMKGAFFALALMTLGAQLALVPRKGRRYPVTRTVLIKLLAGPTVGLAWIYAFAAMGVSFHGDLAAMLLISTAAPTAVNCMLVCLEFDNHPDFAAKTVFYTTLASPLTVTLTVLLAKLGFLPS